MEKNPVVSKSKISDPQVRKPDEDSLKFPLALAKAVHDIVTGKILEPSPNGALRSLE